MTNPSYRRINMIFWLTAVVGLIVLVELVIVLHYAHDLRWDHVALIIVCLVAFVVMLVNLAVKRHIYRR